MRYPDTWSLPLLALLCVVGSCRPATHASTDAPHAMAAAGPPPPLVLAIDQGERRLRRFSYSAPQFTIKVDRRNGGSRDLVMGYEDLPPGSSIPPHRHRVADEIIFVHRGSGVVHLGARRTAFGPAATIYIPQRVLVSLENTGADPLSIAFVFSRPGFEELLRDISVPEG